MGRVLAIWCVRGSVACYFGYVSCDLLGLRSRRAGFWQRCMWSLGACLLLLRVLLAFVYFHHGSHASAVRETARQTAALTGWSWGGGVYINEVFVLYWLLDAGLMWLPDRSGRPVSAMTEPPLRRWHLVRHAVAAFMMFNATVVFGPSFWRWLVPLAVLTLFLGRWYVSTHRWKGPESTEQQ